MANWNDIEKSLTGDDLEKLDTAKLEEFLRVPPPPSGNPAFNMRFEDAKRRLTYELSKRQAVSRQDGSTKEGDLRMSVVFGDQMFACDRDLEEVFATLFREFRQTEGGEKLNPTQMLQQVGSPRLLMFAIFLCGRQAKRKKIQAAAILASAAGVGSAYARNTLRDEFDHPRRELPLDVQDLAEMFTRAQEVMRAVGDARELGIRHLVFALLEAPPDGVTGSQCLFAADDLNLPRLVQGVRHVVIQAPAAEDLEHLPLWQEYLDKLQRDLPPDRKPTPNKGPIPVGELGDYRREAAEAELGLSVDQYANALAKVYRQAGAGDFSLAILGRWGRGKTQLVKRLAARLEPAGYETVFFSAWRFPTTPEVWVHLYETLAGRAVAGSALKVLPRTIRTGIERCGFKPVLAGLAGLAFLLTPKFELASWGGEFLWYVIKAIGVGGLIWLGMLLFGVHRTIARLNRDFLTPHRHQEKLGLQAVIGDDLRALLIGWLPGKPRVGKLNVLGYVLIAGWMAWTGWRWAHLALLDPAVSVTALAGVMAALPLAGFGLLAAWVWPGQLTQDPKRILLVIDDLDRCDSDQLLRVLASLRLVLEQPEISQRIQVAALMEEAILNHAILNKYGSHFGAARDEELDQRIIRDNFEKLFTTHFRLQPLQQQDVDEILKLMFADITEDPSQGTTDLERANRRTVVRGEPLTENAGESEIPETGSESVPVHPTSPTSQAPKFPLLKAEREAIASGMRDFGRNGEWSPRGIRAFVFRYQLARSLAQEFKIQCDPAILVELLSLQGTGVSPNARNADPRLVLIAEQVS